MNWTDVAASTPSAPIPIFQLPRRQHCADDFHDSDDSDDGVLPETTKVEEQADSTSSDEHAAAMRFPDTHFGRMASIFSDRMPCTGMYGSTSHSGGGGFSVHGMDVGGGADVPEDVTMMTLEGSGVAAASSGAYALPPSMDMPSFDEQTSVELQQLFPTSSTTSQSDAAARSFYPMYPSHASSGDHDLGAAMQFAEPRQSLPSHTDAAGQLMVPFPFVASHSEFDEPDDLSAMQDPSTNVMELQEVSNMLNQASLTTPPTAITIPRTTIVSPLNSYGPPRMMLPPSLRDLTKTESLANAFDDEENVKFSPDRRKLCCVDDCKSQARAFNRCKRHGGSKRCSAPDCTKSVQSRGLCIRHGGGSRCQENGCTRAAQSHGKCKMHGGGRPCVVPGCEKKAHLKRLCRKHGGGAKCSLPECDKWAQRQGMCMTHSKHQTSLLASPPPSPPSPASSAASPSAAAAMKRPMHAFLHAI